MEPIAKRVLFDFANAPRTFPFILPVFQGLTELKLHPKVTFLIGENGSGKSTLLEAIAVAAGLNPEGGSKNFNFSTADTHSALDEYVTINRGARREKDAFFLRAESFYNAATYIDQIHMQGPYGGKSLHQQSHGESFLALFQNRLFGSGLYLLDEPEAALSPARQLTLLHILFDQTEKRKSQFILATHSPILMAYPEAWIYLLTPNGIDRVDYQETEHYRLTKDFLNGPEAFLRMLKD